MRFTSVSALLLISCLFHSSFAKAQESCSTDDKKTAVMEVLKKSLEISLFADEDAEKKPSYADDVARTTKHIAPVPAVLLNTMAESILNNIKDPAFLKTYALKEAYAKSSDGNGDGTFFMPSMLFQEQGVGDLNSSKEILPVLLSKHGNIHELASALDDSNVNMVSVDNATQALNDLLTAAKSCPVTAAAQSAVSITTSLNQTPQEQAQGQSAISEFKPAEAFSFQTLNSNGILLYRATGL